MAPDTYLERLRTRLVDFTREHGVLGAYHDDRLFDQLNELERLIAMEERRTSTPSSWGRSLVSGWRAGFVMEVGRG